jgi:Ca2+-binding EF-hand superfamily protein
MDERAAQLAERFDLADLNDDGLLTEDEIRLSMFRRIDSNADGYIDADELSAMRSARRPERAG